MDVSVDDGCLCGELTRCEPRGWCHLLEDDYEWITDKICDVARVHCDGRIVSVLEGGYHVPQVRTACHT